MRTLCNYLKNININLLESVSNDSIWYRTGILHLNWMMLDMAKNIVKKYRINKDNPRPGVIRYMKDQKPSITERFRRNI